MVKPMVHSKKHYVQNSIRTILASADEEVVLVEAVKVEDVSAARHVIEGSTVKAVYIEHWIRSSEAAPGSFICAIYKAPVGVTVFSTGAMAALNNADNKNNILFSAQGLVNDQNSSALSVYRGWVKIPKGKQRFALGDRFVLQTFAQGAIDLVACGLSTFKEYS